MRNEEEKNRHIFNKQLENSVGLFEQQDLVSNDPIITKVINIKKKNFS